MVCSYLHDNYDRKPVGSPPCQASLLPGADPENFDGENAVLN